MEKKSVFWTLASIVVLSFALHFYRIGYPAAPVFDEAHFATYAADFAQGKPSFDIHPPFGKLIFAGALRLSGYELTAADSFVKVSPLGGGKYQARIATNTYGGFPFVLLRVVSALFGVALPLLFYFFLRSVGLRTSAALLGAFFVTAENALLVQTRLIFLDGMYLTFGLAALALYFSRFASPERGRGERTPAWISGTVFGLALGVKLTAITFIGPVIADMFLGGKDERRIARRRARIFVGVAALVCSAAFVLGSALVPPQEQRATWNDLGVLDEMAPSFEPNEPALVAVVRNVGIQAIISLPGYLGGTDNRGDDPERTSRWYDWPFMRKPMTYFFGDGKTNDDIVLAGNRVVWGLSTVAVFVALFSALALFLRSAREKSVFSERPLLLLGVGYLTSMLPFVFFVVRLTYLYHYFPGLVFAIGLAAWMLGRELGLTDAAAPTAKQKRWLFAIALAIIVGFLLAAPATFGFV